MTDSARLVGLVGDAAAVLCLPAGALTFRRSWAALIPRGATVYLMHDADSAGDDGARKAATVLGGRTVRVRPPEGLDWCSWDGDREAFVRLVGEAKARARSRVKSYDELLEQYALERSGPELEPVRLGFGSIDADIRGISAGQVCGVAARTAVGKSWARATIAETFAARQDAGCLVLSLEMPGTEWAERQLAIHADVAPEAVEQAARRGELGPLAAGFLERMRNARVVDEALALDALPDTFADARQRLSVPLRLVLIDYLGLLDAQGRDAYERASALGKGLKLLAKAEEVAVVVAVQVSRAGGDGSEPVSLSMLRDSGVLEESFDFLLGAWRPGKARNLTPPEALDLRDVLRVSILKNRKGADGRTVDLRFRAASRRLYEPAEAV
jgi:replicative DNA helicase